MVKPTWVTLLIISSIINSKYAYPTLFCTVKHQSKDFFFLWKVQIFSYAKSIIKMNQNSE